jgi:hypothetical protein
MSVTPNVMPARISDAIVPNVDLADYSGNYFDNSIAARLDMDTENVMYWFSKYNPRPSALVGVRLTEYNRY